MTDKEEFKQLVQSKYDELQSSSKVAQWLNDQGYHAAKGGKFIQKTVDRLLNKLVKRKPTNSTKKENIKVKEEPRVKISSSGKILIKHGNTYI